MGRGAPTLDAVRHTTTPARRLRDTVRLIGEGIRAGSEYQPLRLHAAHLAAAASRSGHKDYGRQIAAIYRDFLRRWRYVRDPAALETVAVSGPAIWGIVGGAYRAPGHGDCDDATVYLGACARAIGLPVRIVTMSPPGRGKNHSHVYPEIHIPGRGWTPTDPVAHPLPLGAAPPADSRAIWDLHGGLVARTEEDPKMASNTVSYYTAPLDAVGLCGIDGDEPEDLQTVIEGFGAHSAALGDYGIYEPQNILGESFPLEGDYGISPILEVGLADYAHLQTFGPYEGMLALGLDGQVYQYQTDGLGKSWFRRIAGRIKKRLRRFRKRLRKIIKKLPGGKFLVKIGGKLRAIAAKAVRGIAKAAPILSKIAAFVPGYGPAIAAGLKVAGKVASAARKLGAVAEPRRPIMLPRGPRQWASLRAALAKCARQWARENQQSRARAVRKPAPRPGQIASLHGFGEMGI